MLRKPLLLLIILFFSAPALADDTHLLIEKALKASGIAGQLQQLSEGILSAIPDDAFPDKKTRAAAAAFLKKDANKDVLLSLVHAAVRESLDRNALERVTKFWDSKVGKKVGRAQQASLDASALKRVREGRSLVSSLSDARRALLRRIIAAQQTTEGNARLLKSVIRGLSDGSSAGSAQAIEPKEMDRRIGLIEKEIQADRSSAEEIALISSAHLFRSFDDKELEEIALFEESEPAGRYRDALVRGLDQAVFRCAKALGGYSIKPGPAPQDKPQRVPLQSPPAKEQEFDGFSLWDTDRQ